MAFKASNVLPAIAYADLKREAVRLKTYCNSKASQLQSGGDTDQIIRILADIKSFEDAFSRFTGVAGLAAYAIEQENDASYDVVAEFAALTTSLTSVKSWIMANFPKDSNGYLLGWTLNTQTNLVETRQFTTAQTSSLRDNLLSVSALVA